MVLSANKKIGVAILLGAIIVAAGLIFLRANDKNISKQGDGSNLAKGNDFNLAEGFQLDAENGQVVSGAIDNLSNVDVNASITNLTQKLANDLAQGFIEKNPTGLTTADTEEGLIMPDSDSLLNTVYKKYSTEFNLEDKFISENDLKVSKDNSNENVRDYYGQYFQLISEYSQKIKLVDNVEAFVDSSNSAFLTVASGHMNDLIDKLKDLEVPSDFSVLHKTEINLLISEREILLALVNSKEDPFRAVIALNAWSDIETDFTALDNAIAKELKDKGFQVVIE